MILRKPYAILIKYFKLIHIIMFVLFGYYVFAFRKIYLFFSDYVKAGNFTYVEGMVSKYVPWILIVIAFVLLILAISIFLLMNKKNKPVLFYKVTIGYSIILIIVLIYYTVFFKSLDKTIYDTLRIAINRDIILFIYLFNYFFVAFSFIRGFGFDIKKFSFDRDKKELNLEESDSEEYELNVNLEKEDVKSFLNRHKRELTYYVKENKTFLVTVSVIVIVSLSLYFSYNHFVVNKIYHEGDSIEINNVAYRVNSSRISNIDKYGQNMGTTTDCLIVDMTITNNGKSQYLDEEALRVNIGDDYYYPVTNSCQSFSDLGTCYKKQVLKEKSTNNFILIYSIKKEYKDIYLEILKGKSDKYLYKKVSLSYTKDEINDLTYNKKNIEVNNIQFTVNSISLLTKTSYEYEECNGDNCKQYTKVISSPSGHMIFQLELSNVEGLSDDFLDTAVGIKYNNRFYSGKDIQLVGRNGNMIYYSVPFFTTQEGSLRTIITIRPIRYGFDQ